MTTLTSLAYTSLTPVRYFFGERTDQDERPWIKTALMVAAFVPGLLLGAACRFLSLFFPEVEVAPRPQPRIVVVDHLPVNDLVKKDIAYFQELLQVPDSRLKAWLEEKKGDSEYTDPFHGASVISQSRISFDDVNEADITKLLELFTLAENRVRSLNLTASVSLTPSAVQKKYKEVTDHVLPLLRKIKKPLSDAEFRKVCTQMQYDPEQVIKRLTEQEENASACRMTDSSIYFFLQLKEDVKDGQVAAWLEACKKKPGYKDPFEFTAKLIEQKARFMRIVGKINFEDLEERYRDACQRLTKLKIAHFSLAAK